MDTYALHMHVDKSQRSWDSTERHFHSFNSSLVAIKLPLNGRNHQILPRLLQALDDFNGLDVSGPGRNVEILVERLGHEGGQAFKPFDEVQF